VDIEGAVEGFSFTEPREGFSEVSCLGPSPSGEHEFSFADSASVVTASPSAQRT
jgi:hypothetical protein